MEANESDSSVSHLDKAYDDYRRDRDKLADRRSHAIESLDKSISFIASGGVGVSLILLQLVGTTRQWMPLFYTGEFLFVLVLLINMLGHWFSYKAYTTEIRIHDQLYADPSYKEPPRRASGVVAFMNIASMGLIAAAVGCLIGFIGLNL